jgi:hypothetical protein
MGYTLNLQKVMKEKEFFLGEQPLHYIPKTLNLKPTWQTL